MYKNFKILNNTSHYTITLIANLKGPSIDIFGSRSLSKWPSITLLSRKMAQFLDVITINFLRWGFEALNLNLF